MVNKWQLHIQSLSIIGVFVSSIVVEGISEISKIRAKNISNPFIKSQAKNRLMPFQNFQLRKQPGKNIKH